MYSAYKLNKQGVNTQPWHTPFPIWNQSVVPCPVLTVASWPAYRFLRRQVRWSGIPISFRNFQFIVIHTVKGFGIVNKAEIDGRSGGLVFLFLEEFSTVCLNPSSQTFGIVNRTEVDVFLELSWCFHGPAYVVNLISGSSAFSKSILSIWKFSVHVLLKPGLENFEHYFACELSAILQ